MWCLMFDVCAQWCLQNMLFWSLNVTCFWGLSNFFPTKISSGLTEGGVVGSQNLTLSSRELRLPSSSPFFPFFHFRFTLMGPRFSKNDLKVGERSPSNISIVYVLLGRYLTSCLEMISAPSQVFCWKVSPLPPPPPPPPHGQPGHYWTPPPPPPSLSPSPSPFPVPWLRSV